MSDEPKSNVKYINPWYFKKSHIILHIHECNLIVVWSLRHQYTQHCNIHFRFSNIHVHCCTECLCTLLHTFSKRENAYCLWSVLLDDTWKLRTHTKLFSWKFRFFLSQQQFPTLLICECNPIVIWSFLRQIPKCVTYVSSLQNFMFKHFVYV